MTDFFEEIRKPETIVMFRTAAGARRTASFLDPTRADRFADEVTRRGGLVWAIGSDEPLG